VRLVPSVAHHPQAPAAAASYSLAALASWKINHNAAVGGQNWRFCGRWLHFSAVIPRTRLCDPRFTHPSQLLGWKQGACSAITYQTSKFTNSDKLADDENKKKVVCPLKCTVMMTRCAVRVHSSIDLACYGKGDAKMTTKCLHWSFSNRQERPPGGQ
jgi:hypothetical protein